MSLLTSPIKVAPGGSPSKVASLPDLEHTARPKHIGALLDNLNFRMDVSDEKYIRFIRMADKASKSMKDDMVLDIKASMKYLSAAASEHNNSISNANNQSQNSSLVRIFMFYAAMQQMSGSVSFSATEIANETMSFYELDKLCRDFNICPKLLTKIEMKEIWDDFVYIDAMKREIKPIIALNFDQFKDVFVRMALYAYNKTGMKRLIYAVNGFFPTPKQIVQYFCQYCHLHDFNAVKYMIAHSGRDTQGSLYNRSAGDENWRAKEEIKIDLRAKQLARMALKEARTEEKKKKEKEERIRRKQKEHRRMMGDDDSVSIVKEQAKKGAKVQYGLFSGLGGGHFDIEESAIGERGKFSERKIKDEKSLLPANILKMLKGNDGSQVHSEGSVTSKSQASGSQLNEDSQSTAMKDTGNNANGGADEEQSITSDIDGDGVHTFDEAIYLAKRIGTRVKLFRSQYDSSLVYELRDFSLNEPQGQAPGVIESGGPFLDAGHLHPNTECTITFDICNLLLDIVTIDVTARNFINDECTVSTFNKGLISGMTRNVKVKFSTGSVADSGVGIVSLFCMNAHGLKYNIDIPVYYRIDTTTVPRALCDHKTLPDLVQKYLGEYRAPHTIYERQKDEGNILWARPHSNAGARRSTHELRPRSALSKKFLDDRVRYAHEQAEGARAHDHGTEYASASSTSNVRLHIKSAPPLHLSSFYTSPMSLQHKEPFSKSPHLLTRKSSKKDYHNLLESEKTALMLSGNLTIIDANMHKTHLDAEVYKDLLKAKLEGVDIHDIGMSGKRYV